MDYKCINRVDSFSFLSKKVKDISRYLRSSHDYPFQVVGRFLVKNIYEILQTKTV